MDKIVVPTRNLLCLNNKIQVNLDNQNPELRSIEIWMKPVHTPRVLRNQNKIVRNIKLNLIILKVFKYLTENSQIR